MANRGDGARLVLRGPVGGGWNRLNRSFLGLLSERTRACRPPIRDFGTDSGAAGPQHHGWRRL